MEPVPVIEAVELAKSFPVRQGLFGVSPKRLIAVDSVSFSIAKAETVGLVGESGCGKTTVGLLILNLLRADKGKILYNGADVSSLRGEEQRRARCNLQMVFQDPQSSLDPRMLIKTTVGYPLEINHLARGSDAVERVRAMLAEVGLAEDHMYRYPHEFSGGQRQRIGIARALITGPQFIAFDEPTSALDVSVQAQILNLILELQQRHGYSYLFVSHNLSVIRYVSHRVAVMYLGRIVESASRDELFKRPLHPYTQALLAAVPRPDPGRRHALNELSGDVPSPVNVPRGCPFHPRCPKAMRICREVAPVSVEASAAHRVACHLYS